jgi:hypothetical protein
MNSDRIAAQPQGLEKMPTGIDGLDEITGGGLPRNRTSLVIGGPGTGKTVFALQTLVNGLCLWNEPGIFVAFEENSRQIIANAASFGWDLLKLEKEGRLYFLDAHLSPDDVTSGKFDLIGLLASLKAKADEMGAKRIVFDSLDILLTFLNNPVVERQEIYRLHEWLSQEGPTGTSPPDSRRAIRRYRRNMALCNSWLIAWFCSTITWLSGSRCVNCASLSTEAHTLRKTRFPWSSVPRGYKLPISVCGTPRSRLKPSAYPAA